MKVTTIRAEGLAHLSYFVSSEEEAFVIDPRRDCDIYLKLAKLQDVSITNIFETHRNEDYVIGSVELQNRLPTTRIGHSAATSFKYGDENLKDEDSFKIGSINVTCLHTPGHTDDSMCYAVSDLSVSDDPILLFTGDTLFVNEVGRTDLVDIKKHEQMSRKLYHSLHEKILPLSDGIILHPGHGAGSVCGGAIGGRDFSTLGYERLNNIWLDMDEEDFVQAKLKQKLTRAPYFKRCETLNTVGPPLLADLPGFKSLDIDEFESLSKEEDVDLLDTRDSSDYVKMHIHGSISLDLEHMGLFAGWVLSDKMRFIFLLNSPQDIDEASGMLYRVGLDGAIGAFNGSLDDWSQAGKKTDSIPTYSLEQVRDEIKDGSLLLVDVHQPHETEGNYIEHSKFAPLTTITSDMAGFDKDARIAAICPAGFRSATGASIMRRAGMMNAGITSEGLKVWKQKGYPIINE